MFLPANLWLFLLSSDVDCFQIPVLCWLFQWHGNVPVNERYLGFLIANVVTRLFFAGTFSHISPKCNNGIYRATFGKFLGLNLCP